MHTRTEELTSMCRAHADRRVLIWDTAVGDADRAAAMGGAVIAHAGRHSLISDAPP